MTSFTFELIKYPIKKHVAFELLPSRVNMLNQIIDALKDPSLNMVGIYGVGGAGKTTLAKEVYAHAKDEKLFDDVIMISVSQFPNLRRIQAEIACFLALKFDSEEVLSRASQLCERLKKSRSLVILDDVWKKLDLQAAGIPFGDEGQGCKLLVSSRSKDVLSGEMGSQKDFLVDLLSEEESWSLIQRISPDVHDPRFKAIAIEIAKKCAGLPLLIIMASAQLNGEALNAWVNMLKQLSEFQNGDLCERGRKVVESSFKNLPEEDLKTLFLLCASFSQSNIQIQHLLICSMGLRLFKDINTIEEARSRLFSLVDSLKLKGLLLDGDLDGHVKLPDAIRDDAISIASRYQSSFVGAMETGSRVWPNKDCTRISLQIFDIQNLRATLQCPEAELFLLSTEELSLRIPNLFFKWASNLKVVGFTGVRFATMLPSSLGCLRNLITLCLHRCLLDDISVIGELRELNFLSVADSEIVELPIEIGALAQLKLLDLTNCSKLRLIPTNVISNLVSLEELYMRNTCVRWDEEGNVSLLELEKLSHLSSLEIQIVNPKLRPKFGYFYEGLRSYKIILGNELGWREIHESSKMLKLVKLEVNIHMGDAFQVLFRGIEDLYLDEMRKMRSSLDYLIGERFPKLRHLCIKNGCGIQHLIESTAGSPRKSFPELESLHLDNLNSLEMISNVRLETWFFPKLRILKIRDCSKLKSVFSFSKSKCLWHFEEIELHSCENLEAIVSEASVRVDFSELRFLKLKNLPHLQGFCKAKERAERVLDLRVNSASLRSSQGLPFDKITFPRLRLLEVMKCKSLKNVFTRSNLKWLQELERLEFNECKSVEEIVWDKGSEEEEKEGIDSIVFPKLKYVSLKNLKNLKRFSCGFPVKFPSLVELSIHHCPAMEYFGSIISEKNTIDGKMFPRLAHLHIQNGYDGQHNFNLNGVNSLECFYIDHFGSLNANNCNMLKNLLSFSSSKCSIQLLDIQVRSCHNMKAIFSGRNEDEILVLTELRTLKLENLPHLVGFCEQKEGTEQPELLFNRMIPFPNLTSLEVVKCNSLKFVFANSVVKSLVQLKRLEISNCKLLEAIIHSDDIEENGEEIVHTIVLPKLDSLTLYGLPNVKMFGCGDKIRFPSLRELYLECPIMINFMSKLADRNHNNNGDEHLFNELVTFSNLESVTVRNMDGFRYLWHEKFILDDLFFKLKSLYVANCSRLFAVFPANVSRRIQKLETLYLSCCDEMEEIFQCEETECGRINIAEEFALRDVHVSNLASLKYVFPNTIAYSLHKLEQLEIQSCNIQVIIQEDTSHPPVEILQHKEMYLNEEVIELPQLFTLKLKNLPHLSVFCNEREQGFGMKVSFPSLKCLELCECKKFKYVFTTTMVNSLMQLEKLDVRNCEFVEEILLRRNFDEIDDTESIEKIVFPKLEYLSLEKLPNLKTFASGYSVELVSLKELSISYCPVLKNFVHKYLGDGSEEYLFNDMVTLSNLERIKVCHAYSLANLWDDQFTTNDSFLKLKSLAIEYCSKLSVVFPSSICRRFQGLETLYLRCCPRVEEIYQYEGKIFEESNTIEAFCLQDLEIWNLPSLKYIWSTDPPGASTFESLRSVKVFSCKHLAFVFPKSIARRLPQLQQLKIGNSHMQVIIGNTNEEESSFLVPELTVLQLENLYNMRNLCEGQYTFKCPKLKQLDTYGCDVAMNFPLEIIVFQLYGYDQSRKMASKMSAYPEEKSLSFLEKELVCNLEELTVDHEGLMLILSVVRHRFSKLKKVTLRSLEGDSIPLLFRLLGRCSLEKLVFVESYLEEIFVLDDEEAFLKRPTPSVEHMEIVGDDNLKHILKKGNRFNPILENLLTLNVEFCESLINIAPSAVSLENLTCLNISVCCKMRNLVTASTARYMTNLTELKVSKCSMMEDIVERDEVHEQWISFSKLKCVELYDLPQLNSFSSSDLNIEFPLLEQVSVKKCFAMKNFCGGQVKSPTLQLIRFQDEQHWKGDLNTIVASHRNLLLAMQSYHHH